MNEFKKIFVTPDELEEELKQSMGMTDAEFEAFEEDDDPHHVKMALTPSGCSLLVTTVRGKVLRHHEYKVVAGVAFRMLKSSPPHPDIVDEYPDVDNALDDLVFKAARLVEVLAEFRAEDN